MIDLPTNLDDKLAQLPDDLAASLADVPDGGESCGCGLALPQAEGPYDLHRCECGRVWATGDAFQVTAGASVEAHVPIKMFHGHCLLRVPASNDWQHVATSDPAHWTQHIDGMIDDLQEA